MARIMQISNKTISFDALRGIATAQSSVSDKPLHFIMNSDHTELEGVTIPLKIRVKTKDGLHETDGLFLSRSATMRVSTSIGLIEGTPTHRLLSLNNRWIALKDLVPGDLIVTESGTTKVLSIKKGKYQTVADICVPGPHSYILSNGVVSHNSTLANAIGIKMATKGYKVLMVPLEMSKKEMTARTMANVTKTNLTKILLQRLATGERDLVYKRQRRWERKVKEAGGRYTIFKPQEDMTIEEVMASISAYDVDVVIIDYISLLKGVDGDDMWRALGAVARYAKINAEVENRVNILLCQVGDDAKIRYARAISEHSSNSWIWVATKETKDTGETKIEQPKSRNSLAFPFTIKMLYEYMRVEDMSIDESLGTAPSSVDAQGNDVASPKSKKSKKGIPNLSEEYT